MLVYVECRVLMLGAYYAYAKSAVLWTCKDEK